MKLFLAPQSNSFDSGVVTFLSCLLDGEKFRGVEIEQTIQLSDADLETIEEAVKEADGQWDVVLVVDTCVELDASFRFKLPDFSNIVLLGPSDVEDSTTVFERMEAQLGKKWGENPETANEAITI